MNIKFQQHNDTEDICFKETMQIYTDSFPDNERQPIDLVKKRIQMGKSKLFFGLDNDQIVCIALLWYFDKSEFVLLDYMAVKENYRNNKIGTNLFLFLTNVVRMQEKYLILEVEHPSFGNNKNLRSKRVKFYLENGAYILKDTPYILPSLDKTTDTNMLLMISPSHENCIFEGIHIQTLIKRLYFELYQKDEFDTLLTSFIKDVPNQITTTKEY